MILIFCHSVYQQNYKSKLQNELLRLGGLGKEKSLSVTAQLFSNAMQTGWQKRRWLRDSKSEFSKMHFWG